MLGLASTGFSSRQLCWPCSCHTVSAAFEHDWRTLRGFELDWIAAGAWDQLRAAEQGLPPLSLLLQLPDPASTGLFPAGPPAWHRVCSHHVGQYAPLLCRLWGGHAGLPVRTPPYMCNQTRAVEQQCARLLWGIYTVFTAPQSGLRHVHAAVPDHGVPFREPHCQGNSQVNHSGCVPTPNSMLDWADYCTFMAGTPWSDTLPCLAWQPGLHHSPGSC